MTSFGGGAYTKVLTKSDAMLSSSPVNESIPVNESKRTLLDIECIKKTIHSIVKDVL
jgi:hypothetical protein